MSGKALLVVGGSSSWKQPSSTFQEQALLPIVYLTGDWSTNFLTLADANTRYWQHIPYLCSDGSAPHVFLIASLACTFFAAVRTPTKSLMPSSSPLSASPVTGSPLLPSLRVEQRSNSSFKRLRVWLLGIARQWQLWEVYHCTCLQQVSDPWQPDPVSSKGSACMRKALLSYFQGSPLCSVRQEESDVYTAPLRP